MGVYMAIRSHVHRNRLASRHPPGAGARAARFANLSKWPPTLIEGLRVLLKGGAAVSRLDDAFDIVRSKPHGHVAAVLGTRRKLRGSDDRRGGLVADRRPDPRSGFQAGDRPGLGRGDRARVVGAGRLRTRLYAAMDWRHRAALGQAASERMLYDLSGWKGAAVRWGCG